MAKKQYLDLAGLTSYDEQIKGIINAGDDKAMDAATNAQTQALAQAKSYTDSVAAGKSNTGHTHDDRYYTETEIDSKVLAINTSISNITKGTTVVAEATHAVSADTATKATNDGNGNVIATTYETKSDATAKLTEAKTYTDTVSAGKSDKTHNHDTAYDAKGSAANALASANAYTDTATQAVKDDLLNGAGEAYDTLKELGDLIDSNTDAIDALNTVAAGKADKKHTHAIADVSGLQGALDGKAAASHGTHVSYSTTAPVMDGAASVGTAGTVARSDHKHPTDTTRAAKTDLDTHTSNATVHITAAERTKWNEAKEHSSSAHAPFNAEKNQNAFSKITVGEKTVSAAAATDTITLTGTNVTLTPDIEDRGLNISVANASTTVAGIVQLTNATNSTSTSTAATPNSVKNAYDLANTAKTAAATAQSTADTAKSAAASNTTAINANVASIKAHTTAINEHNTKINTLETKVGDGYEAIPIASIKALFTT